MTPLPSALLKGRRPTTFSAWRLEKQIHAATWDQGIGAEQVGGRWSPVGTPVIYASIDPSTTILEVAVHAGFKALDVVPHVLIGIEVMATNRVHVVMPGEVPNPAWMHPGSVSAGQQAFGADLLKAYPMVLVPSVVSKLSWNLLINPLSAAGMFKALSMDPFGLDGRLNPP